MAEYAAHYDWGTWKILYKGDGDKYWTTFIADALTEENAKMTAQVLNIRENDQITATSTYKKPAGAFERGDLIKFGGVFIRISEVTTANDITTIGGFLDGEDPAGSDFTNWVPSTTVFEYSKRVN